MLHIEGFVIVTQDKFYKGIGDKDICVTSRGYDHSRFETRSRVEVGRCYWPDDSNEEKRYFLTNNFYNENKKEIEGNK